LHRTYEGLKRICGLGYAFQGCLHRTYEGLKQGHTSRFRRFQELFAPYL